MLPMFRDTLTTLQDCIKIVKDRLNNGISHKRLLNKLKVVENKLTSPETNFVHTKRSITIAATIGTLAGLGITNIALYTEMKSAVNTLQESLPRLNNLKENVDDIQVTITDISANLEKLNLNHSNLKESLDIFLLIDKIHLKLLEIHSDIETFIQDLVLANSGHVTSTLLSIPQLIKIIHTARNDWNFNPFFDKTNIALYYPLLNSYLNGSSVIIDIPFSSELLYNIYKLTPFPMKMNSSVLEIGTPIVNPLNYILSIDSLTDSSISNDDLQDCKRTNTDLYLCHAYLLTFYQALADSCAASLVKNISILLHCHFKEIMHPTPKHENVHDTHYLFFPNRPRVSIVCPELKPKDASVEELHFVPDQCHIHFDNFSNIADRKNAIHISKDSTPLDINIQLPEKLPPLKIKRPHQHLSNRNLAHNFRDLLRIPY